MAPLERTIGQRVRKARNDLGLSQQALAERLDMDLATVRAIEAGRRGPSIETLRRLGNALATTAGSLLGEDKAELSPVQSEAAKLVGDLAPDWQHAALAVLRTIHDQVVASDRRKTKRTEG